MRPHCMRVCLATTRHFTTGLSDCGRLLGRTQYMISACRRMRRRLQPCYALATVVRCAPGAGTGKVARGGAARPGCCGCAERCRSARPPRSQRASSASITRRSSVRCKPRPRYWGRVPTAPSCQPRTGRPSMIALRDGQRFPELLSARVVGGGLRCFDLIDKRAGVTRYELAVGSYGPVTPVDRVNAQPLGPWRRRLGL
ncbi:MAG: hypothetical protein RL701_449 [Pseudomonadota bacterium]